MSDTYHNCTDDQLEAVARHMMQTEPECRIYWLGVGDEALADPRAGAPYKHYCRRILGELHASLQRKGVVLP